MTTTTYTTLDLARQMADVADALAQYPHLPTVGWAIVHADGRARLYCPFTLRHTEEFAWLCGWAQAFGTEITIELSYGGSDEARTEVDLHGHPARLDVSLHSGQAYELGAALQRPISTAQPTITVTAAELLAAIGGGGGDG